ncbi:MAG: hypothetical protein WAL50_21650 [Kineosporiaceae bacterium]
MATSGFPEPSSTPDLPGLLLSYLDYYRTVIIVKIGGLGNDDLQRATVPSGWTPAGLVNPPPADQGRVHYPVRWDPASVTT